MATNAFYMEQLATFRAWILKRGWEEEKIPHKSIYEVARFRKPDGRGTNPPLILYTNKFGNWVRTDLTYLYLIREFQKETKK